MWNNLISRLKIKKLKKKSFESYNIFNSTSYNKSYHISLYNIIPIKNTLRLYHYPSVKFILSSTIELHCDDDQYSVNTSVDKMLVGIYSFMLSANPNKNLDYNDMYHSLSPKIHLSISQDFDCLWTL